MDFNGAKTSRSVQVYLVFNYLYTNYSTTVAYYGLRKRQRFIYILGMCTDQSRAFGTVTYY